MYNFTIFDTAGQPLHAGRAKTLKNFVERLARTGKDLSGADLRSLNLAHVDLSGATLNGACLDGSDLRGTILRRASLVGASLRGIRGDGMQAARANFARSDMRPHPQNGRRSSLRGATFTYACLDGAKLDRCDFSGSHMSSSTLVGAQARRASFREAIMHNADWADAEIISSDFAKAIMRSTWKIGGKHMPDRTVGATVVGNRMTDAEIGEDSAAFKRDRTVGGILRTTIWGGITAGAVVAGAELPIDVMPTSFGEGAGFVALATATLLLKERVEDIFKDALTDLLDGVNLSIRQGIASLKSRGMAIGSMACAFLDRRNAKHVTQCLMQKAQNRFISFAACAKGQVDIIICDRKHLAEALARVTDAMAGRFRNDRDLVLIRTGDPSEHSPRAVVLTKSGDIAAHYQGSDGSWHAQHWPSGEHDDHCSEVLDRFIRSMLLETETTAIDFDPNSHSVRKGKDGSVVIVRRADGRLHNPHGPVIVTPDDEVITLGFKGP